MGYWLAVDIGGTKIATALVSEKGAVSHRAESPTDPDDPWPSLEALVRSTLDAAAASGLTLLGCGAGCGGPMTTGGEQVTPFNLPGWQSFPLRSRLAELTGLRVAVDNDAMAIALAERWLGAAQGVDDFLTMVVSTGVGGALVSDGRMVHGASWNGGNISHLNAVPSGRACPCGGAGCLEAEASGKAIEDMTGAPPAQAGVGMRLRTGRLVGAIVAQVAILMDLRLILVGGSVALGFGHTFFDAAQAVIDDACHLAHLDGVTIQPVRLGSDAPLVGAAAIARDQQFKLTGH